MKVIELLNNMSVDKNYRPTIKYKDCVYKIDTSGRYINVTDEVSIGLLGEYSLEEILKDEVEIIEEPKEIEKFKTIYCCSELDFEMINKINELVEAVNELKGKE